MEVLVLQRNSTPKFEVSFSLTRSWMSFTSEFDRDLFISITF